MCVTPGRRALSTISRRTCRRGCLADPLIRGMLARGLLTADALEPGVAADAESALLDNAGQPSRVVYYTGPLLRARDWECTAVPELRLAALRLAERQAGAW